MWEKADQKRERERGGEGNVEGKTAGEKLPQNVFENDFEPRCWYAAGCCLPLAASACLPVCWLCGHNMGANCHAPAAYSSLSVAVATTVSCSGSHTNKQNNMATCAVCDAFPILLFWLLVSLRLRLAQASTALLTALLWTVLDSAIWTPEHVNKYLRFACQAG